MSQNLTSVPELTPSRPRRRSGALIVVMIAACAITASSLRPGATSVGPVLPELSESLGMTGTVAGLLTALPGLSFAVFGLLSNRLIASVGQAGALIVATALTAVGMALRVFTGSWVPFLALSVVALAGMAVGNVVLPALIKREFPRRSGAMATIYTTFLAVGATLPTLLSSVLQRWGNASLGASQGWRLSLGFWAGLALLALTLWLVVYLKDPTLRGIPRPPSVTTEHQMGPTPRKRSIWASRTAVSLMLFFGLQSMQAYIQFGWLPAAYRAGGLPEQQAGFMLAIIALGGIPGGLIMPTIVARAGRRHTQMSIVFFAILLAVGYGGIALVPTTVPWLWAVCLSISGFCFPTALALIIGRTTDPRVTARVSGFVQPVGYILAACGPFLVGTAWEVVGSWPKILILLALTSIPLAVTGVVAVGGKTVDQELAGSSATPR